MNTIQKSAIKAAAVIMVFGMLGCTAIGAGVGAVGGAVLTGGNPAGVIGGAVVGGVIGHSM
ncbi:MAG: prenyltransferase [Gallionella sp.]|nr:prenyltransferase [Gallionella sp.]